jgi:7-dehydrocholesterol reductase
MVMLMWYTNVFLNGSVSNLLDLFSAQGVFTTIYNIWSPYFFGSPIAWKMLSLFALFQLLLMRLIPGRIFEGPLTPRGNVPVYKANGIASYFITLVTFYLLGFHFKVFSPTLLYDHFGAILGALNIFSLLFCAFLYFKGRFAPSSTDAGTTGHPIFDYFWGMELYPRILGWDVKMFTNCRFGMMGWSLILLSFAAKQKQLYGLSDAMIIAVALQLVYITKFFWWETGYLRSMDIMYDRAGFCICWGCLVWVPCIYTSPTLYLVNHPNQLGLPLSALIFALGIASIFINYMADRQRQYVRSRNGDCTVWMKKPELILANYRTDWGEERQSVLLVSGWWGISRHFHYIPEILGAFFWSVPALFHNVLPYFYLFFLIALLLDRAYRQEKRCAMKYGKDWDKYCDKVPFRLIPFVY